MTQTKVSREFLIDFAYIASFYVWDEETIEEVKRETRNNQEMMRYWRELANAHRNGYLQTKENNYMRLEQWKYEYSNKKNQA